MLQDQLVRLHLFVQIQIYFFLFMRKRDNVDLNTIALFSILTEQRGV